MMSAIQVPEVLVVPVDRLIRSTLDKSLLPELHGGTVRVAKNRIPTAGGNLVANAYLTECARCGDFVAVPLDTLEKVGREIMGNQNASVESLVTEGVKHLVTGEYARVVRFHNDLYLLPTPGQIMYMVKGHRVSGAVESSV